MIRLIKLQSSVDYEKEGFVIAAPSFSEGNKRYHLDLLSTTICECDDENILRKAKEALKEALDEIRSNSRLRKLVAEYDGLGEKVQKAKEKVRRMLIILLQQPPTALRLINNELCPYMKGEEIREYEEEEIRLFSLISQILPE